MTLSFRCASLWWLITPNFILANTVTRYDLSSRFQAKTSLKIPVSIGHPSRSELTGTASQLGMSCGESPCKGSKRMKAEAKAGAQQRGDSPQEVVADFWGHPRSKPKESAMLRLNPCLAMSPLKGLTPARSTGAALSWAQHSPPKQKMRKGYQKASKGQHRAAQSNYSGSVKLCSKVTHKCNQQQVTCKENPGHHLPTRASHNSHTPEHVLWASASFFVFQKHH